MTDSPPRPLGLLASAASTVGVAVFFAVMAALSLASGHGSFSSGVSVALLLWAVLVGAAGVLFWRRVGWVRGGVVAAGLLHVLAFGQFALASPPAILGALAGLVAVVGAVLPSTRDALSAAP